MKSIAKFTFILFLVSYTAPLRSNNILGQWICHKITYQNGKGLEINHPLFSEFISYEFERQKVFISNNYEEKGKPAPYRFIRSELNVGSRKFKVAFSDKYLILEEIEDELKYYFLRRTDFIEANRFFDITYRVIEQDTIFERSFYLNPKFKHTLSFSDYLRKSISNFSPVSAERHLFNASFILNRKNQIVDVKIEQGINKKFDREFLKYVMESQKFWNNTTGKNLLIVQKFNFFEQGKFFVTKENKKFLQFMKKGNDHYKSLDFDAAISAYEMADSIPINKSEFTRIMKRQFLKKLAISYLAKGDVNNACQRFYQVGNEFDFSVRNYVLSFCN